MYINVGVRDRLSLLDIPSKRVLKAQIAENGQLVQLYCTDAFGENSGKTWKADELPLWVKFSVTGPNPYTSRKWYATIENTAKGVKVS